METANSGFVQPQSAPKGPICDKEHLAQIPLSADCDLTSSLYRQELDIIETNIAKSESKIDLNATNSDHMDRYFKKVMGPEGSNIKSAYRLLDTVDELESGVGIKS